MQNNRFLTFLKDLGFIFILILTVFFLKGVFLSTIQPIFVGQDEARHYNTIQYLAEPENAVPEAEKDPRPNYDALRDKDDFSTYNYSEEIQKTAAATNTDLLRSNIYNTIIFSENYDGRSESVINSKVWKPYNYYTEPDTAGTGSLYHKIVSQLERLFTDQTILVRFYLIRIFSVLLGTLAVLLTYLTAKTIGFSAKISLILTTILSFQPKLSLYSTNINYDALLIPMFFLFSYAGALTLKKGLNWKNLTLLLGSMVVAIQTKPTGYILVVIFVGLISYLLYEKVRSRNRRFRYSIYSGCFLVFLSVAFYLYSHFLANAHSLGIYISKTITFSNFVLPSPTYWGTLSWANSPLLNNATDPIFVIETLALIGLCLLLFSRKFTLEYPDFLPAKKYILFLIGMIVVLQLGIRTADWTVFSRIGTLDLGTPGRYFLPNLSAHILLVGAGLGAILAYFKKERYFAPALLTLLILMFSLMMYLIFDVIILRFYF